MPSFKNLAWAGAAVVAVLALSGCSPIDSGYVTGKDYQASYVYYSTICTSYNSQGVCTTTIYVPNTMPESWSLDLKNGEKTGWVTVSESEYESYEIGDFYGETE